MTPFEKTVVRLMRSRSTLVLAGIALLLLTIIISGLGRTHRSSNPILSPQSAHAVPPTQVTEVGLDETIRKANFELSTLQGELLQVLTASGDTLVSYEELDRAMARIQDSVATSKQRLTILRVPQHAEQRRDRFVSYLTELENRLVHTRALVASGERELVRKEINDIFHALDRLVLGF